MKREFLKGFDLTDDQVDQIMAEHGKAVTKAKGDFDTISAENQTMKMQLEASENALKDFEKANKDNEGLKESLAALKTENERIKTEAADQIKNERIGSAIKVALTESGTKYADLLDSKFDRSKLKIGDDGKVSGITEQLDDLKKTYADLFKTESGVLGGAKPADPQRNTSSGDWNTQSGGIKLNPIFRG